MSILLLLKVEEVRAQDSREGWMTVDSDLGEDEPGIEEDNSLSACGGLLIGKSGWRLTRQPYKLYHWPCRGPHWWADWGLTKQLFKSYNQTLRVVSRTWQRLIERYVGGMRRGDVRW
ncbi:3-oxo-5-alpha-steroid 4-dehydrogenase [Actinidia rufa]|uniref:3-oxo-5-alpha-steroid 4-dehydrogenase n=1 Tax=Actinidia rufa TaxID=165716 RepID=A0A7J0H109_9ERIC|nr:3-oxo-5-alpha-steroid 4-dehydrogenase [Actinidia rufa]